MINTIKPNVIKPSSAMHARAHGFGMPTSATLRGTGAPFAAAAGENSVTAHARGRVWATNGSVLGTHAWRDPLQ